MTVHEAAVAAGISVFDTALPQPWVDEVLHTTGHDVRGHFVMSYDVSRAFGNPAPVTPEGTAMEADLIRCGLSACTYASLLPATVQAARAA